MKVPDTGTFIELNAISFHILRFDNASILLLIGNLTLEQTKPVV